MWVWQRLTLGTKTRRWKVKAWNKSLRADKNQTEQVRLYPYHAKQALSPALLGTRCPLEITRGLDRTAWLTGKVATSALQPLSAYSTMTLLGSSAPWRRGPAELAGGSVCLGGVPDPCVSLTPAHESCGHSARAASLPIRLCVSFLSHPHVLAYFLVCSFVYPSASGRDLCLFSSPR